MNFIDVALIPLLKIGVIVFGFAMLIGSMLTLAERKQSAYIQRRKGPNRAYLFRKDLRLNGLFHLIADGLKMLLKEDFVPHGANRKLHLLAPMLGLMPAMVIFAIVPFMDYACTGAMAAPIAGKDYCFPEELGALANAPLAELSNPLFNADLNHWFQVANIHSGLLYIFAVTGLAVYGSAIAGWASNSKFSLLGGLRASAQMISYEVSMGLSLAGILMIYGTLDVNELVREQGELLFGFLPQWGIVLQPLAFFLFLTASIAESKRAPFDMPEAESELVAGYFTEYSAMKFAVFSLGEFVTVVFIAAIVSTLFLGGWQVPWLYADGFHFTAASMPSAVAAQQLTVEAAQSALTANTNFAPDIALPYWLVVALRIGGFVTKVLLMCFLQLQFRWTVPRFRYDQIMHLGWKILLPLSIANLLITALVILLV
ncbi:MAG: NADH-quinone oxidoreductase subunit H [Myxococcales bacterium]|nr:NADH-quinone oxidoreductase subunit H [Myxococcales bacterium]